MAGTQQGPPPEAGPADDIWKASLTGAYKDELAAWHRSSGWARAKIMANEDRKGTGDLFAAALKNYTPTGTGAGLPEVGGVQRLLSQFTGGNING
jgi:hypothetical protein